MPDYKQHLRILIVDDDESTRTLLSSVLTAEGHLCATTDSVTAAEAALRQQTFHLAFIDLYLGTSNGLNVLDLIKVLQPQCACVMMTAHMSVETVAKSLGSGAIEYLRKPLLIDDLLAAVQKAQAGSRRLKGRSKTRMPGPRLPSSGAAPKCWRFIVRLRALRRRT